MGLLVFRPRSKAAVFLLSYGSWLVLSTLVAFSIGCSSSGDDAAPAISRPAERDRSELRTMFVAVDTLNMRVSPSGDGRIVSRLQRGTAVAVLASIDGWTEVQSGSERGWVATRYLTAKTDDPLVAPSRPGAARKNCPADRSFTFSKTPRLVFSQDGAHGLVVIEANVNASGAVTSTKVVSNETGRKELALAAQKELGEALFVPPVRNCRPIAFIYTYKRVF